MSRVTRRLILGSISATAQAASSAIAGQRIHAVAAVPAHAAQHQRLAVVALLDAGIKVAVLVQADEELRQQFLALRADIKPARCQVRLAGRATDIGQTGPDRNDSARSAKARRGRGATPGALRGT